MHHIPDREPLFKEFRTVYGKNQGVKIQTENTVLGTISQQVDRLIVGTARIATNDSESSFKLPEQKTGFMERLKGVCEEIKETVIVDFRPAGILKLEPGGDIELHQTGY